MAIAFDASTAGSTSGASSLTFSHTCTGSNLTLCVFVYDQSIGDNTTGVTYNGVAMTKSDGQAVDNDAGTYIYMFYLLGPATGAHNVVVSRSSSSNSLVAIASSYTGTSQSAIDSHNKKQETTSTSTSSISTTVVASSSWIVSGCRNACGTITAGSGTTLRRAGSQSVQLGDSNGTVGTGSQSLNFGGPSCDAWGECIVSLAPGSAAYTLTVDAGSFSLTGVNTTLNIALKMIVDAAAFALTGISAGLSHGYTLVANAASFALTGIDVGITKTLNMITAAGSFALTGIDVAINVGRTMAVSAASFVLTGLSARFSLIYTALTKHTTTYTAGTKHTTSYSASTKHSTTYTPVDRSQPR